MTLDIRERKITRYERLLRWLLIRLDRHAEAVREREWDRHERLCRNINDGG